MANEKIVLDSKERVAYDLMMQISYQKDEEAKNKDRSYWLNLYHECHNIVVYGHKPKTSQDGV